MEFFCYHRDRPGSPELRDELCEEHWAYLDQYAKTMIARGPGVDQDLGVRDRDDLRACRRGGDQLCQRDQQLRVQVTSIVPR